MGRNSSGNRGAIGNDGGGNYSGSIKNVETLKNIQNPQVYSAIKDAISRYHSVLGVRQREVKLADMDEGVLGVHRTRNGVSEAVFLNKTLFKYGNMRDLTRAQKADQDGGWGTKSNRKGFASVVQHELAHATWNNHLKAPNAVRATASIQKLYATWKADKNRKKLGYGSYANSNVNEFFAETAMKAVSGRQDKYTKAIKTIIKKYKL